MKVPVPQPAGRQLSEPVGGAAVDLHNEAIPPLPPKIVRSSSMQSTAISNPSLVSPQSSSNDSRSAPTKVTFAVGDPGSSGSSAEGVMSSSSSSSLAISPPPIPTRSYSLTSKAPNAAGSTNHAEHNGQGDRCLLTPERDISRHNPRHRSPHNRPSLQLDDQRLSSNSEKETDV